MLSSAAHAGRAAAAEASSPELALVDHALAIREREHLAPPDDTLTRLAKDIAFRRLANRSATLEAPAVRLAWPREIPVPAARWHSGASVRTKLAIAGAVGATLAGAFLLGIDVSLRGNPAEAESREVGVSATSAPVVPRLPAVPVASATTKTTVPPPRTPSTTRQSTPPAQKSKTRDPVPAPPPTQAPKRFAWAPVSGASAYRVEFFRGDRLIFAIEAARPQLDLPTTWTFRGRKERLTPGTYRWYVWPVRSGRRQSQATVQAELLVR